MSPFSKCRGSTSPIPKAALILVGLLPCAPALAAERAATIARETFACTSWAGWHEYGLASLTARGARMNKHCPVRIPAGAKVAVVEDDAGAGATEIRWRGKNWFVDNERLR